MCQPARYFSPGRLALGLQQRSYVIKYDRVPYFPMAVVNLVPRNKSI